MSICRGNRRGQADDSLPSPAPSTFLQVLRDPGQSKAWKSSAFIHSCFGLNGRGIKACGITSFLTGVLRCGLLELLRRLLPSAAGLGPGCAPSCAPGPPAASLGSRPPAPRLDSESDPDSVVMVDCSCRQREGFRSYHWEPAPRKRETGQEPNTDPAALSSSPLARVPTTAQNAHLTSSQVDLGPSRVSIRFSPQMTGK